MWEKDDLFFDELEKCIGEYYVIEEESQKIVYISNLDENDNMKLNYGKKCFEVFHSRKSPCPFCPKTLEPVGINKLDGYIAVASDFSETKMLDSYVPSDKKWYQYRMSSYFTNNESYRIVIRGEVENMMGLSSFALGMIADYKNSYESTAELQKKMAYEIIHDGMTGLYNKGKYLYDVANIEAKNEAVGIIVCDINDLKSINDTFGHMVGDEIIRAIAQALKKVNDENTKCYRIGGDEFAVLQKHSNEKTIKQVENEIEDTILKYNDDRVALAIGFAVCNPEESFDETFQRADKHMYEYKSKMKNK